MPVLGKSEDNYDSLKLITQALGNNVAGDGGGGVLQNHIYLWPSNGDLPSDYVPTSAGLAAALAASTSGDTIWLPSMTIALTAGITLPAGVALTAISMDALLAFSGFSGVGITCSIGSSVSGFTVTMVSNGTTAIGIEARVTDALVERMNVTASGGTVINIAVDLGADLRILQANEAWLAGGSTLGSAEEVIAWSDDWYTGNPHWNRVAGALPEVTKLEWAGMASDGTTLYASFGPTFTLPSKLYMCANPKGAVPVWTCILQAGTVIGPYTIDTYFSYTYGPVVTVSDRIWVAAHIARTDFAEPNLVVLTHDGVSWTVIDALVINGIGAEGVGRGLVATAGLLYNAPGTLLENLSGGANAIGYEFYRTLAGAYYLSYKHGGNLYIHGQSTDYQNLGATSFDSDTQFTKISGAEESTWVYAVSHLGDFWASSDGSTFTNLETWKKGYSRDRARLGGGILGWTSIEFIAHGNQIGKVSSDNGATWGADLTGDWWSAVQTNVTFGFGAVGFSLVFV